MLLKVFLAFFPKPRKKRTRRNRRNRFPGTEAGTVSVNLYHDLPYLYPDLPFLAFLEHGKENHQKARIFILSEPLKSLGQKGENAEKSKEFLRKEKRQGIQKKTRKGRSGKAKEKRTSPKEAPELRSKPLELQTITEPSRAGAIQLKINSIMEFSEVIFKDPQKYPCTALQRRALHGPMRV